MLFNLKSVESRGKEEILKIFRVLAKWMFILCIPPFLLTASIGGSANSLWLYQYGFHRHGVSQASGLADAELEKVATGLIHYFNSGEEYFNIIVIKNDKPFELFNEREVAHLKDVKGLIRLDYWVWLGTLVYFLAYAGVSLFWRKDWRRLALAVVWGAGATLVLMLALGLGTLLGFDRLFLQFHLLSFANDLWMLDPTRDYMIMIFPWGFWYDAFLVWALVTTVGALILGGVSGRYLLARRRRAT